MVAVCTGTAFAAKAIPCGPLSDVDEVSESWDGQKINDFEEQRRTFTNTVLNGQDLVVDKVFLADSRLDGKSKVKNLRVFEIKDLSADSMRHRKGWDIQFQSRAVASFMCTSCIVAHNNGFVKLVESFAFKELEYGDFRKTKRSNL